jgi:hypothetical protein
MKRGLTFKQMNLNIKNAHNHKAEMNSKDSSSFIETQQVKSSCVITRARHAMTVLCAASWLILPSAGQAAVYYVDVGSGSDSNTGTSQTSAWAHLPGTVGFSGSGWVTLQNGDTVYVKGGTINNAQVRLSSPNYTGNSAFDSIKLISGHLAATPWGSGRAIFDQQNSRTYGFWIGGPSTQGITIDGFEVRNIAAGGPGEGFDPSTGSCCVAVGGYGGATYIKIRRCYLHDALRSVDDTGHGIEADGVKQMIIEYNNIGPRIGTKGIEPYNSRYGAIRNNFITNTGDHGIAMSLANNWDIYNNVVYMVGPYKHDPVFGIKSVGGTNDCWNNLIYRDIPPNPDNDSSDHSQGYGIFAQGQNRCFHNTIANFINSPNGHENGAGIAVGCELSTSSGNDIQNNLVFHCVNGFNTSEIYWYNSSGSQNNTFRFNDLYYANATDTTIATFDGANNNYYSSSLFNAHSFGNGNVVASNIQVGASWTGGTLPSGLDSNFHPNTTFFQLTAATPTSVTITANSGIKGDTVHGYSTDVNKFNTDILGNARTAWSIGAYEFSAGGSVVPLGPSNLRVVQN